MEKIGITKGLRGYFVVLYDENGPIQTGIGSYKDRKDAIPEAIEWAKDEGIETDNTVKETL